MSHYPNPFDFVPFAKVPNDPEKFLQPELKKVEKWMNTGTLRTGYIDIQIKVLMPVHIVGDQKSQRNPPKIIESNFYTRNEQPIIPSSCIRGLLRNFIETACNCWASQLTPHYESEPGIINGVRNPKGRHIGFEVIKMNPDDPGKPNLKKIDSTLTPALPDGFFPKSEDKDKMDLSSFIFGYIPVSVSDETVSAWRGCLQIEDARFDKKLLSCESEEGQPLLVPDILGKAFMGRPWPNASSWWYFFPYGLRKRKYHDNNNIIQETTEFIGKGFRGRKFYYHQHPRNCIDYYLNKWPRDPKGPKIDSFKVQCILPSSKTTDSFRIYFHEIPDPMLDLLFFALSPGNRLRHKLGYGKAYGYGTMEFIISGGGFRNSPQESMSERSQYVHQKLANFNNTSEMDFTKWIHRPSMEYLARIMWYDPSFQQTFSYPPFTEGGFKRPVDIQTIQKELSDEETEDFNENELIIIDRERGKGIASRLPQRFRQALDFEVYQETAIGYDDIKKRKLEDAI